jgi:hypothetical protein
MSHFLEILVLTPSTGSGDGPNLLPTVARTDFIRKVRGMK